MENASKALLMAAGVLLGIMILTLAVYLFINFGGTSAQIYEQIRQSEIEKFNAKFIVYEEKENTTIYDIITVTNLAKENNRYYNLKEQDANDENFYVKVKLENTPLENKEDVYLENLIKNENILGGNSENMLPTYKCSVKISPKTQRVYEVNFSE